MLLSMSECGLGIVAFSLPPLRRLFGVYFYQSADQPHGESTDFPGEVCQSLILQQRLLLGSSTISLHVEQPHYVRTQARADQPDSKRNPSSPDSTPKRGRFLPAKKHRRGRRNFARVHRKYYTRACSSIRKYGTYVLAWDRPDMEVK